MAKEHKKKNVLQDKYKIYQGIRCLQIIIPALIERAFGLTRKDYVRFEYNVEENIIIIRPIKNRRKS